MNSFVDKVEYRNYNGQDWLWPKVDRDCWDGMLHDIENFKVYFEYIPENRRMVAVQAGGNAGWVPRKLAEHFNMVYTFEPDPLNFYCLTANCPFENVIKQQAALGETNGMMYLDVPQKDNVGMLFTHLSSNGAIPVYALDNLALSFCDFIQLDIEGFEYQALKGAERILSTFKPVLSLEINGHSFKYGYQPHELVEYLNQKYSYKIVKQTNMDYIFRVE